MSQFYVGVASNALPPDVATSYVTDQGTAVPDGNILNVTSGFSGQNAGATTLFTGTGNTVQLEVSDENGNTFLGRNSGHLLLGAGNTAFGVNTLFFIDNAVSNTAIGAACLQSCSTGFANTAVGESAGQFVATGSYNTLIGYSAGITYFAGETNNLVIGPNLGIPGENNTTRIGSSGNVITKTATVFVFGVYGNPVSATTGQMVTADSTGLIGTLSSGTAGQILTSNGAGAAPTFQGPGGVSPNFQVVTGSLTNSQIKNLHGTPVQLLPAPGAGNVIYIESAAFKLNYGGNNAFTTSGGAFIAIYYNTSSQFGTVAAMQTSLTQTANTITFMPQTQPVTPYANAVNAPLNFFNPSATEIAGNAANNNTISYNIVYRIITI